MQEDRRPVKALHAAMAQKALPELRALADDLEALAGEVFRKRVPYDPQDGASVMALSFVTKQLEHLRSVRVLVESKQHRDAHLVARTMIEGMGRLLWAFRQRPERTDLWLWFGAILDWRQIKKNEEVGLFVDPEVKAELKGYVELHGPRYFKPGVRRAIEAASQPGATPYVLPEDPWANDWTTTTVKDMFVEVQGTRLYESIYRDSSEWVHWGPRTILRAMQMAEWGVAGFEQEDPRVALISMQLAAQSLLQSLEVLELQFSLGIEDHLERLGERMVEIQRQTVAAD